MILGETQNESQSYPGMKRGGMYVALFVVTSVPAALDILSSYLIFHPRNWSHSTELDCRQKH